MKKPLIPLLLACLLLLAGCGERELSGSVAEVIIQDGRVSSFLLRSEEGRETGVLISGSTVILSWPDVISPEDFKSGSMTDVTVQVEHDGKRQALAIAGGEVTAYEATYISITSYWERGALTLSDGTAVDLRHSGNDTQYLLSDGAELLHVWHPSGPDHVYVGGVESFIDLPDAAQPKVLAYYEEQGLLYDEMAELERAYQAYLSWEQDSPFNSHMLEQAISPTASNDRVMYFLTSVTLPIDGQHAHELRLGAAFDRETGEHIPNTELFSCPEEEVLTRLLDIAGENDPRLRAQMQAAFSPECLIFFPGNLELAFPYGSLPSQEHAYMLGLDYDDELRAILHEWAIPLERE